MKIIGAFAILGSALAWSSGVDSGSVVVEDSNVRSVRTMFSEFKAKHGKTYASVEEENARFAAFKQTVMRVAKKNAEHVANGGEEVFTITKFADLTPQEFKAKYLKYTPKTTPEEKAARGVMLGATPAVTGCTGNSTCDWRKMNAVSPVKDQGQCGSCWAFSATEEIESMWFLKHGTMPILAPQQIVSCDTVDQGCNGGDTPTAYKYVIGAQGLESEQAYPYRSGDGNDYNCKYDKKDIIASITGFTYATPPCQNSCDNQNEAQLASNMATTGPVSVCLNAEPWQDYGGGILKSGCGHAYSDMDHCVQLVGYNNVGTTPYWIIRNSWNTDWGIDGYIYVSKNKNLCGVANEATFATSK